MKGRVASAQSIEIDGRPDTSAIIPGRVPWPPMAAMQLPTDRAQGRCRRDCSIRGAWANCWSEPMQRLVKQIGISDVAIAEHCRKLGVPVPERGYWNKLQVGKPVTKKRNARA